MNHDMKQALRERQESLRQQPDDYHVGSLEKESLLTMTAEAIESIEALERCAATIARVTLEGKSWVSPAPAKVLETFVQLNELAASAEAGSEACGLALDAEDLMLRSLEEELELGAERLAEARGAEGAPRTDVGDEQSPGSVADFDPDELANDDELAAMSGPSGDLARSLMDTIDLLELDYSDNMHQVRAAVGRIGQLERRLRELGVEPPPLQ